MSFCVPWISISLQKTSVYLCVCIYVFVRDREREKLQSAKLVFSETYTGPRNDLVIKSCLMVILFTKEWYLSILYHAFLVFTILLFFAHFTFPSSLHFHLRNNELLCENSCSFRTIYHDNSCSSLRLFQLHNPHLFYSPSLDMPPHLLFCLFEKGDCKERRFKQNKTR